ncbi:hypothetical protein [Streptomyces sp. ODS28]|uniref:hypothetical protein n=1 Tax=Streptomyces sp. ODS28 TaxID=3136688 RepID=UPI0031EBC228
MRSDVRTDAHSNGHSDGIHWWRQMPAGNRTAVWNARQRLHHAAAAMLRAGALAARSRAGFYGARYAGHAESYLQRAEFDELSGQPAAAAGGRALAAHLPAAIRQDGTVALYQGLHALRHAVTAHRSSGTHTPFDRAVPAGACHELAEAVRELVHGTEGVRITLGWSRQAGAPEGCPPRPEPVVFTPGDLPALQQAAQRYVREEPSVSVRLTGAVVRLRRSAPAGPGAVRLRVLAGAEVAQVRAGLDEEAYRIAAYAHLSGLPISIGGRLESRGGFRRLTGAHGVAPVPVPADGGARERLLAALGEGLDGFGSALGGVQREG